MMLFSKIFNKLFHHGQLSLKHVFSLFSFIFIVWAVYRHFPEVFPVWVEELILKPLVWLGPTAWMVTQIERENLESLGFTKKNLKQALYWGVGLGIIFAVEGFLANVFKYRGLNLLSLDYTAGGLLGALAISFATSLSEEALFRGYIFSRLTRLWQNELWANLVSAALFALIYLPVSIFVLGYRPLAMIVYLLFIFAFGSVSAFVFARTKNLLASIFLHVFWSWPIILFR